LVQAGLMGIEVYHPSHTPEQIQHLEFLSTEYHLLKTGGSDYHGSGGTTLNQFNLSLELLEQLKQKATHLVE
jgi:predicted metal-dependent phosphoesterase TrpH